MQKDKRITNLKFWGRADDGKVTIYINKQAYDSIYNHGLSNQTREVGGLLMGTVTLSKEKYRVDIVGISKAEMAPGSQTQVQFDQNVWQQLIESSQREFPEYKVVGWYHTHPGFGVFLSRDDIESHKLAFSNPWHVAAVCDPVRNEFAFFYWDGTEIKQIRGFYTYDILPSGRQELVKRKEDYIPKRKNTFPVFLVLIVFLIFIAIGTVFYVLGRSIDINKTTSIKIAEDNKNELYPASIYYPQDKLWAIFTLDKTSDVITAKTPQSTENSCYKYIKVILLSSEGKIVRYQAPFEPFFEGNIERIYCEQSMIGEPTVAAKLIVEGKNNENKEMKVVYKIVKKTDNTITFNRIDSSTINK